MIAVTDEPEVATEDRQGLFLTGKGSDRLSTIHYYPRPRYFSEFLVKGLFKPFAIIPSCAMK